MLASVPPYPVLPCKIGAQCSVLLYHTQKDLSIEAEENPLKTNAKGRVKNSRKAIDSAL